MRALLALIAALAAAPLAAEDRAAPVPSPAAATALLGPAINVTDVERELHFYVDGLGMKKLMQIGPDKHRETMLGFANDPRQPGIILMSDATLAKPVPLIMGTAFNRLVVRVANLPAVVQRLHSLGFTASDVRDVAMGYRMASATDPEGFKLELVESGVKMEKPDAP